MELSLYLFANEDVAISFGVNLVFSPTTQLLFSFPRLYQQNMEFRYMIPSNDGQRG